MPLSFQLYSSRSVPSQIDFLPHLAALGYSQVEGYGGVYDDPAALRAALDATGLHMPSGHMALTALETDFEGCVALSKGLGMNRVFAPHLDPADRPADRAGWADLAHRLAAIGARLGDHGLAFGWHNHDFELRPMADGSVPLDILLTEAPDIAWEGDLAWVIRGGADAADWVARYGDRLAAVHIKDIAAPGTNADQDGWADLGHGTVDWAALLDQINSVAPDALMIVEHDKPRDARAFAETSIAAYTRMTAGPE
ncbi:MAG: sugar phosphate isomerase/epimerase [Pseudomonadota bacterium]